MPNRPTFQYLVSDTLGSLTSRWEDSRRFIIGVFSDRNDHTKVAVVLNGHGGGWYGFLEEEPEEDPDLWVHNSAKECCFCGDYSKESFPIQSHHGIEFGTEYPQKEQLDLITVTVGVVCKQCYIHFDEIRHTILSEYSGEIVSYTI